MNHSIRLLILFISVLLDTQSAKSQSITSFAAVHSFCVCASVSAEIEIAGCDTGQLAEINWGDGTTTTYSVVCGSAPDTGLAVGFHVYPALGTYTLRAVLIDGGVRVDSTTFSYTGAHCTEVSFNSYLDANFNCNFDTAESTVYGSYTVAIDSSGYTIDTINFYGYTYYRSRGPVGTVYAYRVLALPYGYVASCTLPVYYDTITTSFPTTFFKRFDIGLSCSSLPNFDLSVNATFRPALTGGGANTAYINTFNNACVPVPSATVKFEFSPKFAFSHIISSHAHTVTGTTVTIDAGSYAANEHKYFIVQLTPVAPLILGDTVNSLFSIYPIIGDGVPSNNIKPRCDTVVASYDPNAKSVYPTGHITPGTRLEYLIQFENTGNAPAVNIHVLDTLSDLVDPSTVVVHGSTHKMNLIRYTAADKSILKFDFPNIMLPDSSDHEGCKGSLVYSVRSSYALTPGTTVTNRAGIYFDFNEVVMTNTAYSLYPNPVSVADATSLPVQVFPNPVSNTLHVDVAGQDYSHLVVYDVVGRQVRQHSVSSGTNTIDVKSLPSGSYYGVLSGAAGKQAFKFTKQ